ncbi:MAG: Pycsar system effector family protein [Saprospiraceae bacterium]
MMEVLQERLIVKKEKKQKKKKSGISKQTINIIRTTQRNNIDLTAIADNKANVLLSLNAIIIAALIPIVIANVDIVFEKMMIIPLMILAATSFITIYLSAAVLKPSNFDRMRTSANPDAESSPFFFGNFYEMEAEEYFKFINPSLSDPKDLKAHLAQDLFYIGKRLGEKMSFVRQAYNIFTVGILVTLVSFGVVVFIF